MDYNIILSGVFGIIGTIIGSITTYTLQKNTTRYSEWRSVIQEFKEIKNEFLSLGLINDYYIYQNKIKQFLLKHDEFLSQPEISEYWYKHLLNPWVTDPIRTSGINKELIKDAYKDIMQISLSYKIFKKNY